nr:MAG TPA: hypothetical protein [Caudoviricetes sp.]
MIHRISLNSLRKLSRFAIIRAQWLRFHCLLMIRSLWLVTLASVSFFVFIGGIHRMQRKERFTECSRDGHPVLDAVFLQACKLPLRHADGNGVAVTLCVRTTHTYSPPFVLLCNKCNCKISECQSKIH